MDPLNSNLDCNETINQFGVECTNCWVGMNVKELTHSQQQPQAPKTHKKKPTIRQAIRTVFCAPKGPFLTDSWSWMKSSARHTLSNQQAQPKEAETVNLTENVPKGHFQRLLVVALRMYLTLYLLLFEQSM